MAHLEVVQAQIEAFTHQNAALACRDTEPPPRRQPSRATTNRQVPRLRQHEEDHQDAGARPVPHLVRDEEKCQNRGATGED